MSNDNDPNDGKYPPLAFGPVSPDTSDDEDDGSPRKYRTPSGPSSPSTDSSSSGDEANKSENHRKMLSSDEEEDDDELMDTNGIDFEKNGIKQTTNAMPDISSSSDDDSDEEDDSKKLTGIIMHPESDEDVKSEDDFDGKSDNTETISIFRPHTTISNTRLSLVKLPQYVRVDSKPFDKDYFDDTNFVSDNCHFGKISAENTIRWKYENNDPSGKRLMNAKIVKWSNGTASLRIGKKLFDIVPSKESGLNHCFMKLSSALFGQAAFKDKVTFRSLEKIPVVSKNKNRNKPQTVRILQEDEIGLNPEIEQAKLKKIEEEKLRAAQRRENQQRRIKDKPRYSGLVSRFLEKNGESLNAIKKKYAAGGDYNVSDEDSDDSFIDRPTHLDSDEDEEEDSSNRKNKKDLKKKKVVIDDDDDED
uniref:RNA polymerase-associated protein LEO1 n=1 Tax=Parastrongyloides trichosuri TaxID=131310 RepID=A0A0N4ZMK0_PARTI